MPDYRLQEDLRAPPGALQRLRAMDPAQLTAMAITTAVALAAAVIGLVAATGKPVPIALAVGGLGGVMLLQFPLAALWIVLAGVLVLTGQLYMFQPALLKSGWLFSLLGFFLGVVAVLYPVLGRHKAQGRAPALLGWTVAFVLVGALSLFYSDGSLDEGVTAFKRYYQYVGITFLFAAMPIDTRTIRRIFVLFGVMLVAHLAFGFYQRFWIVPQWQWLAGVRGFIPLDLVVGAFEGVLGAGGSSAIMAFSCLVGLVAVVAAWHERILSLPAAVLWGLVALIPLGLGETRVVALWLPVALIALNVDMIRRRPAAFVSGALAAIVLAVGVTFVYALFQKTDTREMTVSERIEEAIEGNFGSSGYTGNDGSLNRTSVLSFWVRQQASQTPTQTMFGHGLGASFGGDGRGNGVGHLDGVYRGRGIALTTAATLLWDLGIVGFVIYMGMLVSACVTAARLVRVAAAGLDRAVCRTLFATSVLMLSMPIYTNYGLSVPSLEVLTALMLGLIAWRWRLLGQRDPFGDTAAALRAQALSRQGPRRRHPLFQPALKGPRPAGARAPAQPGDTIRRPVAGGRVPAGRPAAKRRSFGRAPVTGPAAADRQPVEPV